MNTVIYGLYKQNGVKPSKEVAGMMLSAIISDTVLFRSPTCTEEDKKAVKELAEIAGVDYEKYGMDMLKNWLTTIPRSLKQAERPSPADRFPLWM